MSALLIIFIKALCCGTAALGFGILFNTPARVLLYVWAGGFVAGLVKFSCLGFESDIIVATFSASLIVGITGIPLALWRQVPPVIFAIPCVIPLVPGAFAYRTMLGIIKLAGPMGTDYINTVADTVRNGVLTLSLVMAIAIGLVAPMIVLEKYVLRNYFTPKSNR